MTSHNSYKPRDCTADIQTDIIKTMHTKHPESEKEFMNYYKMLTQLVLISVSIWFLFLSIICHKVFSRLKNWLHKMLSLHSIFPSAFPLKTLTRFDCQCLCVCFFGLVARDRRCFFSLCCLSFGAF